MDKSAIDAIVTAVRAPIVIDGLNEEAKFALVPAGMTAIDLSKLLGQHDRIDAHVEVFSVESFCEYLKRYGNRNTVIFADESKGVFNAILDYHPPLRNGTDPSLRGDVCHTLSYHCPQSDQWQIWTANAGILSNQDDFARFIETNLKDIWHPPGADMLQVALHLQVHKSAEFESGLRLDNGQVKFRYVEQIKGTTTSKAGDIEIPTDFTLQLPVLLDGPAFQQAARFKYRMDGGKLSLGYELVRPKETFRAAVKQVTVDIAKGAPLFPIFRGAHRG